MRVREGPGRTPLRCLALSVSVAWALADDETRATIEQIHREASGAAQSYLAQQAGYTRKRVPGHDQPVVIESGAFTGVRYQHRTSRAVDPHLHDHVLVHGKVLDPSSGQWLSIDGTSFMHETKAAGMIYQAHQRAAFAERLGWEFGDVDQDGLADLADRAPVERGLSRSHFPRSSAHVRVCHREFRASGHGRRGVYAPGHIGELTQYLPFELVDDVLSETETVQRRLRDLPSRVGVYLVLALVLSPPRLWLVTGSVAPPCSKVTPTHDFRRWIRTESGAGLPNESG